MINLPLYTMQQTASHSLTSLGSAEEHSGQTTQRLKSGHIPGTISSLKQETHEPTSLHLPHRRAASAITASLFSYSPTRHPDPTPGRTKPGGCVSTRPPPAAPNARPHGFAKLARVSVAHHRGPSTFQKRTLPGQLIGHLSFGVWTSYAALGLPSTETLRLSPATFNTQAETSMVDLVGHDPFGFRPRDRAKLASC